MDKSFPKRKRRHMKGRMIALKAVLPFLHLKNIIIIPKQQEKLAENILNFFLSNISAFQSTVTA